MYREPYETLEINGFIVKIYREDSPMNPRECDNLGTMVCWHRRHTLGDEQPTEGVVDWMREIVCNITGNDLDNPKEEFNRLFISLPLYLYDHSGITMHTSPFSCPWDSGQVGFIYVAAKKAKKEFDWKRLTKSRRERIEQYLESEVKVYDQFLTGEVYGYKILEGDENIDSCWGFFGSDYGKSGMMDEIQSNIKSKLERITQEKLKTARNENEANDSLTGATL